MAWRVARSLIRLREQINERAPTRSKASDGTIGDASHSTRDSDHNPWVRDGAVGVVTAIDITNDPEDGCDATLIVNALVASRDPRIKYVIWNRQILSSSVQPWTWRAYNGRNPHTHHFHLSVKATRQLYDAVDVWRI